MANREQNVPPIFIGVLRLLLNRIVEVQECDPLVARKAKMIVVLKPGK